MNASYLSYSIKRAHNCNRTDEITSLCILPQSVEGAIHQKYSLSSRPSSGCSHCPYSSCLSLPSTLCPRDNHPVHAVNSSEFKNKQKWQNMSVADIFKYRITATTLYPRFLVTIMGSFRGQGGKDHTLNAAVCCLHTVFLCSALVPKPNKDYMPLKLCSVLDVILSMSSSCGPTAVHAKSTWRFSEVSICFGLDLVSWQVHLQTQDFIKSYTLQNDATRLHFACRPCAFLFFCKHAF